MSAISASFTSNATEMLSPSARVISLSAKFSVTVNERVGRSVTV